jgi:hypothetical protein
LRIVYWSLFLSVIVVVKPVCHIVGKFWGGIQYRPPSGGTVQGYRTRFSILDFSLAP